MALALVVLALAVPAVQAPSAAQAVTLPGPAVIAPSPEFINWAGFGYLPSGDRTVSTPFRVPGDWTSISNAPADDAATPWRMRIVIQDRVERVETLPNGVLRPVRATFDNAGIARVRRAATLLGPLVTRLSNGKVALKAEVVEEKEPLYPRGETLNAAIARYLLPRFNQGRFDAEDRIFRGPYSSVFVVHPMANEADQTMLVNGTPVSAVSAVAVADFEADGTLAQHLAARWADQVRERAKIAGWQAVDEPSGAATAAGPRPEVPGGDWSSIATGAATTEQFLARMKAGPVPIGLGPIEAPLSQPAFRGVDTQVTIGTDPERGSILVYSETGAARTGGVALPSPKSGPAIDIAKTPTLGFWAKSSALDALALRLTSSDGHRVVVTLGRDVPANSPETRVESAFAADGTWHRVSVDLRATGLKDIATIVLGGSPASRRANRQTLGPIVYSLAEFAVSSAPADAPLAARVPDMASPDPIERALWARSAKPGPELRKLLKDPSEIVKLNALQPFLESPDLGSEAILTELATLSFDAPIAETAVDALSKLPSETAKAAVHRALRSSGSDFGRSKAAEIVARTKETAAAAEIIPLLESRTLSSRIAAVRALGQIPGPQAAIIRLAFIQQADPELKLVVTETSDPADEYQMRKLLWSAVNEPSDAVRAASDIKLIQSPNPQFASEGYKGVRDDSIGVRLELLAYLAAHPSEAHRGALRLAVTDRSPQVRAAAIDGFAALSGGAAAAELGAVVEDPHPDVQLALIQLARKTGMKLSSEQITRMKDSPDPRVQSAIKELGE